MTLQRQRIPDQSVRLVGSTLKLWSEQGLAARQPLLVVRDVVHHSHLERGRLLLWRIKVGGGQQPSRGVHRQPSRGVHSLAGECTA